MTENAIRPATQYLDLDGGTLAYEVTGASDPAAPLVVLAHGMGDDRRAFRFLAPGLAEAGYRVAVIDLRGAGESSTGWSSYSRTDIAGDLVALVEHLTAGTTATAVLVGHSIAGGAATIAAAIAPHLFTGVVELAPFTRKQSFSLTDLRHGAYRRGATHLAGALLGSAKAWTRYYDAAYPVSDAGTKPVDFDARLAQITAMLAHPGRMKALQAMLKSAPTDAAAQLAHVTCPVLVIQGGADPDWVNPRAEGEAILADLPAGLGQLALIPGSGHYLHAQHPLEVLALMLPFLTANAPATTAVTFPGGARA